MKTGKSLVELATEIQRQAEAKKDFIADTRSLSMGNDGKQIILPNNDGYASAFELTQHAHRQVGERLKIPAGYYDRMLAEAPDLLAHNVNQWFARQPERRMIRTLDSKARAFLSDRYRIMDNDQIAEAVLPILMDNPDLEIISSEITENRMYIKALNHRLEGDVGVGDMVQAGIVISNSEIGAGAFKVEPLLYRLVCTNGMVVNAAARKAYHTGKRAATEEMSYEIYRDETLAADDKAFFLKTQDLVRAAVADAQGFNAIVNQFRESKGNKLNDPVAAVEVVSKRYALREDESNSVLRNLIEGASMSQFGLVNAVTRTAQDVESYDRATDLERLGGTILDLDRSQWKEIQEAA